MPRLIKSLDQWGTDAFPKTLKQELESLEKGALPLNQATCQGGLADESNISALINSYQEKATHIEVKVGIFFNEIIAGCNCGDDPMEANTYCELLLNIDKANAEAEISILN